LSPPFKKNCFLGYDGIWLWGSASKPWCAAPTAHNHAI
jgi:hypothetical protein